MRFVAGQGAVAEQLPVGTVAELLTCTGHQRRLAGTWQRAIGKMLPVGAVAELQTCRGAVAELLLAVKSYSTIGKRILAKMRARRSSCGMPVEFNRCINA